ncbi:Cytosolic sorting protein GGA2/TOM1 [Phaffia rhodozyma]|uniref:Cytosolic sorting protein GGA2/TOM1 n=1 Tax=Phaffia rhodozyma TaxID=264483 RepID=A0A0F7SUZ4_PHARH|nr:Cytosolic sorting protein GGA2/TOM1 [Phaffia rhodozyma]
MSTAGVKIKAGIKLFNTLTAEKAHSSVTDWIEILTNDNYARDELDGVAELVESVDIQPEGSTEAARAIRKKLKYGSVHRQLRALTLLNALSENSRTFPKSFATSPQLLERLKETAKDSHADPEVRRRVLWVLKGWKVQSDEGDTAFRRVSTLYAECAGGHGGQGANPSRRGSLALGAVVEPTVPTKPTLRDDGLWEDHSWDPSPKAAAAARAESKAQESTRLADVAMRKLEAAKEQARKDAEERQRKEMERRERDLKSREEKINALEKLRAAKAAAGNKKDAGSGGATGPKRPPFNFEKEKPIILQTVASASQAANNLINAIRLVNRETESITENSRVQKYLEESKLLRRKVIRYIQLVEDEEYIGTLLSTNESIITALQLYDKMSKPASQDSDDSSPPTPNPANRGESGGDEDGLTARMAAQKLQNEQREGELMKLQTKQRMAIQRQVSRSSISRTPTGTGADELRGLDFSGGRQNLPPPIGPTDVGYSRYPPTQIVDSGSDLTDYDSSDDDFQLRARSRRPSHSAGAEYNHDYSYGSLDEGAVGNLLDSQGQANEDPFADPFFDQVQEREPEIDSRSRKEWTSV